jgi:hypothetical protein
LIPDCLESAQPLRNVRLRNARVQHRDWTSAARGAFLAGSPYRRSIVSK